MWGYEGAEASIWLHHFRRVEEEASDMVHAEPHDSL